MIHRGRTGTKKVMSPTKKCSVPFFSSTQVLLLCISGGSGTVNENRNILEAICASDIAILSDPKHYNSTILSTQFVSTPVFMSKCEYACRLKLQFLNFSTVCNIIRCT